MTHYVGNLISVAQVNIIKLLSSCLSLSRSPLTLTCDEFFFVSFLIVCFASYFVFSIAVPPYSPGLRSSACTVPPHISLLSGS